MEADSLSSLSDMNDIEHKYCALLSVIFIKYCPRLSS